MAKDKKGSSKIELNSRIDLDSGRVEPEKLEIAPQPTSGVATTSGISTKPAYKVEGLNPDDTKEAMEMLSKGLKAEAMSKFDISASDISVINTKK